MGIITFIARLYRTLETAIAEYNPSLPAIPNLQVVVLDEEYGVLEVREVKIASETIDGRTTRVVEIVTERSY